MQHGELPGFAPGPNVLAEWSARIPPVRLDPDDPPEMHAGLVYTVDRLPLLWGPPTSTWAS